MSTRTSLKAVTGTPPRHVCFETADRLLKDKNTELVEKYEFPSGISRLCISTRKINHRIRTGPIVMVATFCPFCGEKLNEEKANTDPKRATASAR